MHPLEWSRSHSETAVGAMKFICTERGTVPLQPIQQAFLESMRDFVFRQPDLRVEQAGFVRPEEFGRHISDEAHRNRSLEYLTIVPYIQVELSEVQADLVREYFTAAGSSSETLTFLNRLAHHHIFAGQLCLARKLLPQLLPGGVAMQMSRAIRMIRETRGDPRIAAPFLALEEMPDGTLGSAYFRFHRNRGFALPGEPGCIPEELSALHDITHILSGYNTNVPGEIFAQAFAGGSMPKHALLVALTGLLSYHNGIVFDAGGTLPVTRNALEPHEFWHAFARGMKSVCLVYGWDYKQDWQTPVAELRRRFRIEDATDIWDDPPPEQAPGGAARPRPRG